MKLKLTVVALGLWGMVGTAEACSRCRQRASLGLAPIAHSIPVQSVVSQAPTAYAPVVSYAPVYSQGAYSQAPVQSAPGYSVGTAEENLIATLGIEALRKLLPELLGQLGSRIRIGGDDRPRSDSDPGVSASLSRIESKLDRLEQLIERRVSRLETTTDDALEAIKNNAAGIIDTRRETLALFLSLPVDNSRNVTLASQSLDVWAITDPNRQPSSVRLSTPQVVTVLGAVGSGSDKITFVRWTANSTTQVGYVRGQVDILNVVPQASPPYVPPTPAAGLPAGDPNAPRAAPGNAPPSQPLGNAPGGNPPGDVGVNPPA